MIDYMAQVGFEGIDMSLEGIRAMDDSYKSVLYSAKTRAAKNNIEIPACHLPYYMPDPSDKTLMDRFAKDIRAGIEAAAYMGIPMGVVHPIALRKSRVSAEEWARRNIEFLTPLRDYAYKKGVKLCIENMASDCEGTDHLFGTTASEIYSLAAALGCGVCWDFGHASLAKRPIDDVKAASGRLLFVHAHDNNGYTDQHLPVFDGKIDWVAAMSVLSEMGYNGYISIEARSYHIPADRDTREQFGRRVAYLGQRLAKLIK